MHAREGAALKRPLAGVELAGADAVHVCGVRARCTRARVVQVFLGLTRTGRRSGDGVARLEGREEARFPARNTSRGALARLPFRRGRTRCNSRLGAAAGASTSLLRSSMEWMAVAGREAHPLEGRCALVAFGVREGRCEESVRWVYVVG